MALISRRVLRASVLTRSLGWYGFRMALALAVASWIRRSNVPSWDRRCAVFARAPVRRYAARCSISNLGAAPARQWVAEEPRGLAAGRGGGQSLRRARKRQSTEEQEAGASAAAAQEGSAATAKKRRRSVSAKKEPVRRAQLVFANSAPLAIGRPSNFPHLAGLWEELPRKRRQKLTYKHSRNPRLTLKYDFVSELNRYVWGVWDENLSASLQNVTEVWWHLRHLDQATFQANDSLESPNFTVLGVEGVLSLEFFPAGQKKSIPGYCSLFLKAMHGNSFTYQFLVRDHHNHVTRLKCTQSTWESDTGLGYCNLEPWSHMPVHEGSLSLGVLIASWSVQPSAGHSAHLVAYSASSTDAPYGPHQSWWSWHGSGWTDDGDWRLQYALSDCLTLTATSPVDLSRALHSASTEGRGLLVPAHRTQELLGNLQVDPMARDLTSVELEFEKELRNTFIGRVEIKKELQQLFSEMRHERELRKRGLALNLREPGKHMVFVGNPGTGKTMIARSLGKIMKKLDVLSKGHVVEVQRGDLVGEYIGKTAQLTRSAIERAAGGILLVDEAYRLTQTEDERDFGQEALEELMSVMDFSDDLVIMFAGYPAEMEQFMKANPGLKRRIYRIMRFPDYTVEELAAIFMRKVAEAGFEFDFGITQPWLENLLKAQCPSRVMSRYNGGLCDRLLGECRRILSQRIVLPEESSDVELLTFTKDDVAAALESFLTEQ